MKLSTKIESLLFYRAEPVAVKELSETLGESLPNTQEALQELRQELADRGVVLVQNDTTVALATAPEAHAYIEKIRKAELEKPLGNAGTETLTIVLYYGPVSRSHIDYIRGVNSTYTLRHLMVRGLIERIPNPNDKREFLYKPTLDALQHLGISRVQDLPEYDTVRTEFDTFFKEQEEEKNDA